MWLRLAEDPQASPVEMGPAQVSSCPSGPGAFVWEHSSGVPPGLDLPRSAATGGAWSLWSRKLMPRGGRTRPRKRWLMKSLLWLRQGLALPAISKTDVSTLLSALPSSPRPPQPPAQCPPPGAAAPNTVGQPAVSRRWGQPCLPEKAAPHFCRHQRLAASSQSPAGGRWGCPSLSSKL